MKFPLIALCSLLFIVPACGNSEASSAVKEGKGSSSAPSGTLYFDFAGTTIYRYDLANGKKTTAIGADANRNGWDLSHDASVFTLTGRPVNKDLRSVAVSKQDNGSGSAAELFSIGTDGRKAIAIRSPDGSKYAVSGLFNDGNHLRITDAGGKLIETIRNIDGQVVHNNPVWMPDNTLLLGIDGRMMKSSPDFKGFALIREMPGKRWGTPAVSRDGSMIAYVTDGQVWVMDKFGKNARQVTSGNTMKVYPEFSPDGKYIVAGVLKSLHATSSGTRYLYVFPADAGRHRIDTDSHDKTVMPVSQEGARLPEAVGSQVLWR